MIDPFGPKDFYRRWRFRRAARDYYERLRPWLEGNHGTASTYTVAQIDQAVSETGLNRDYIVFGYAAFLDERTFTQMRPQMRRYLSFYDARTLLVMHGKYRGKVAREETRSKSTSAR